MWFGILKKVLTAERRTCLISLAPETLGAYCRSQPANIKMAVRTGRFANLRQDTFVYFTIDMKQLAFDSSSTVLVDEKIPPIKSNYSQSRATIL